MVFGGIFGANEFIGYDRYNGNEFQCGSVPFAGFPNEANEE